jgi:hypothetical protein
MTASSSAAARKAFGATAAACDGPLIVAPAMASAAMAAEDRINFRIVSSPISPHRPTS